MINFGKKLKKIINARKKSIPMNLYSNISKYENISFDIFDTLLKRNVSEPARVFELMAQKLGEKYLKFAEKRVLAEMEARKLYTGQEISLRDIYLQYCGIEEKQIDSLIKLELETEKAVLVLNQEIWAVYKRCIEENKKVFIISDMYLPKEFVEETLKALGVKSYQKLYISSEYGKTKRAGDLFDIVLREQKIDANNFVHIGDSIIADYYIPKSRGIKAFHIPRIVKRSTYELKNKKDELRIDYLNTFINNNISISNDKYYHFGYERFGMFLWGYAKWLLEIAEQKELKKLYFFSRDGLIMKKAVDICNHNSKIKTYYLEVSRRSLRVPILWMNSDFELVLDMIVPSKIIPINAIFDGIGLEINEYKPLLKQYGFDVTSVFERNHILENKNLIEMYRQLQIEIEIISKKEYELLKKYIIQNDLAGEFAVIDIGWSGGMQRYLKQTLDKMDIKNDIHGYYIGIAPYYKRNIEVMGNLNLIGYLFDFKNNRNTMDKRSCFVGLFETLFLEQAGSVKNYELISKRGIVEAKRYPYEYAKSDDATGEYFKIQSIQQGAMQFVNDIYKCSIVDSFQYTADELFEGLYKAGAFPQKKEAELFADFRFYDEGEMGRLAEPKSILYYIFHIQNLKKDFLLSHWKVGFMKKLFKIPLPYKRIYDRLKKISEM